MTTYASTEKLRGVREEQIIRFTDSFRRASASISHQGMLDVCDVCFQGDGFVRLVVYNHNEEKEQVED